MLVGRQNCVILKISAQEFLVREALETLSVTSLFVRQKSSEVDR